MKSYCVKQRKQTECIQGSEQYVKTKNGRNAMKCKCSECGITKFRFVKGSNTGSTKPKAKPKAKPKTKPKTRARAKTKGSGLLLGKNSPFQNIPLVGAIL